GQADCVVEFAISQQPSIGGHHGTAKLEHQAAVKIEPNSIRIPIHPSGSPSPPRAIQNKLLIAISESRKVTPKLSTLSGECGFESFESLVIQSGDLIREGHHRCGRRRTADVTTAANCDIRVT